MNDKQPTQAAINAAVRHCMATVNSRIDELARSASRRAEIADCSAVFLDVTVRLVDKPLAAADIVCADSGVARAIVSRAIV